MAAVAPRARAVENFMMKAQALMIVVTMSRNNTPEETQCAGSRTAESKPKKGVQMTEGGRVIKEAAGRGRRSLLPTGALGRTTSDKSEKLQTAIKPQNKPTVAYFESGRRMRHKSGTVASECAGGSGPIYKLPNGVRSPSGHWLCHTRPCDNATVHSLTSTC